MDMGHIHHASGRVAAQAAPECCDGFRAVRNPLRSHAVRPLRGCFRPEAFPCCPWLFQAILSRRSRTWLEDFMQLKVVLEPSEDGGFTVYVPSLPGCISEGDTRDEALANIAEAIQLYLEPVEDDLSNSPGAEVTEIAV